MRGPLGKRLTAGGYVASNSFGGSEDPPCGITSSGSSSGLRGRAALQRRHLPHLTDDQRRSVPTVARAASVPSTATTSTASPTHDGLVRDGAPTSPVGAHAAPRRRPGWRRGGLAPLADHAGLAGDGPLALRPHGEAHQQGARPPRCRAQPAGRSRRPTCSSGSGESMSISDPSTRLIDAAHRQQAEADHLHLEHSSDDAEEDQQQPDVVDRQDLEREERQQQAHAADDARQDRAGAPQLDGQPERARG